MDYKKIVRSRSLRLKILQVLSFIPDKPMLKMQYRIKTGRKLNLNNPQRYTEKLQWYKLYYKNPLMVQCVDKYDVRDYVKSKGLKDILIPCYGVYDSASEINWDILPQQFVMKDTLGSGGNSVIIVKDKTTADLVQLASVAQRWINNRAHCRNAGREWPYYSGKNHRIIIEKYIDSDVEKGGLIDYKFLCFSGKAELLYVLADRVTGQGAGCGFFDLEFNQLPYKESDEPPLKRIIPKPENFEKLKMVAEILADTFPCARIDLYDEKGKIVFGEITYFDSSGYMCFEPDKLDFQLGKKFIL